VQRIQLYHWKCYLLLKHVSHRMESSASIMLTYGAIRIPMHSAQVFSQHMEMSCCWGVSRPKSVACMY
jgi:hypothetical protein